MCECTRTDGKWRKGELEGNSVEETYLKKTGGGEVKFYGREYDFILYAAEKIESVKSFVCPRVVHGSRKVSGDILI